MSLFSVAPMLDITDRHCRALYRLFSPNILLYSEMIHTGAITRGDTQRFLQHDDTDSPVALQLGGSDTVQLAEAARLGEQWGYDEINLNVGCPSDRVQAGRFGACLMAEPELVAECVQSMQAAVSVPVTVKHRIGIDDQDAEQDLQRFVQIVSEAGCQHFIVHARKAWLKGLNPKQNRDVPPLDYDRVYRLKQAFPELTIAINGGIPNLNEAQTHLQKVDSVMMGRAIVENSWMLNQVEPLLFEGSVCFQSRRETVLAYCDYIDAQMANGIWLKHMARHLMGLYTGQPGAKNWRRALSEGVREPSADSRLIKQALTLVE